MTEIRKFEFGSDEDDLTHDKIKQLPQVSGLPRGAKPMEHDEAGYYSEAHKHGYKVHFNGETAYLSKDDGKKEHERDHWRKK